jgi:hypothetical protein
MEHFQALRNFLLLSQGDFTQLLVEGFDSIGKTRASCLSHLENAIMNSNAANTRAEILSRVSVHTDELFCLDYQLDFPLNLVVISLDDYYKSFHFIWKLKRAQQKLDETWMQHVVVCRRRQRNEQEWTRAMRKSSLLRSEMIHIVSNLHSYVMMEVVDASWEQFLADVNESKSLSQLKMAHDAYLQNILLKGMIQDVKSSNTSTKEEQCALPFLTPLSKSPVFSLQSKVRARDAKGLSALVHSLLDYVLIFCAIQQELVQRGDNGGDFLLQLDGLATQFWNVLHDLLIMLQTSASKTLQFLGQRLDFNRFYLG